MTVGAEAGADVDMVAFVVGGDVVDVDVPPPPAPAELPEADDVGEEEELLDAGAMQLSASSVWSCFSAAVTAARSSASVCFAAVSWTCADASDDAF